MQNKIHMLKRELDILKALDHPNIVKFFGIYMDVMYIHFIMEYCEGDNLFANFKKTGPPMCCNVSKIM